MNKEVYEMTIKDYLNGGNRDLITYAITEKTFNRTIEELTAKGLRRYDDPKRNNSWTYTDESNTLVNVQQTTIIFIGTGTLQIELRALKRAIQK